MAALLSRNDPEQFHDPLKSYWTALLYTELIQPGGSAGKESKPTITSSIGEDGEEQEREQNSKGKMTGDQAQTLCALPSAHPRANMHEACHKALENKEVNGADLEAHCLHCLTLGLCELLVKQETSLFLRLCPHTGACGPPAKGKSPPGSWTASKSPLRAGSLHIKRHLGLREHLLHLGLEVYRV